MPKEFLKASQEIPLGFSGNSLSILKGFTQDSKGFSKDSLRILRGFLKDCQGRLVLYGCLILKDCQGIPKGFSRDPVLYGFHKGSHGIP